MITEEYNRQQSVEHFLEIVKKSRRGKFKIYIGMAAGVGKTFRMLQEAHNLLAGGVDVCLGIIETHGRQETFALMNGIPEIPRKNVFYHGKQLDELDLEAVLIRKPEVVLVDELAHTNIPGSRNNKRWEDIEQLLDAGISVISALNIQHIESLNREIFKITGIEVKERVPDSIVDSADEMVNVDLTIKELLERLESGKIYEASKIKIAQNNFFQEDKLLFLRELALKEVTRKVGKQIDQESAARLHTNKTLITCISSNAASGVHLIRRSSRMASLYNSRWIVLFVETPDKSVEQINSTEQRKLLNNFNLAAELGAEVVKLKNNKIAKAVADFAIKNGAGLIVSGKPLNSWWQSLFKPNIYKELIDLIEGHGIDILIVASNEKT
jgi:two-component system sensor histidine kinase KdpD